MGSVPPQDSLRIGKGACGFLGGGSRTVGLHTGVYAGTRLPPPTHPHSAAGERLPVWWGERPPSFPSPLHQKPSSSSPQSSALTLGHSSGQGIPALLGWRWVLALEFRPSPATLFSFSILSFSGQLISLKVSPMHGLDAVFSVYAINLLPSIVHLVEYLKISGTDDPLSCFLMSLGNYSV